MLILTRRVGENIVVGDDIVISVMEVRGEAVRLGIRAPREVTVHREEVYLELQRANRLAAQSAGGASDDAMAAVAAQLGLSKKSRGASSKKPTYDESQRASDVTSRGEKSFSAPADAPVGKPGRPGSQPNPASDT